MNKSILLDTSFLISLVDNTRSYHQHALDFYTYFLNEKYSMYLSTIVISEFSLKQPITDLPLQNFKIMPFNYPESISIREMFEDYFSVRDSEEQRVSVKDDFKISSQTEKNSLRYFITEDQKLYIRLMKMKENRIIQFTPILLQDGYTKAFNINIELSLF